MTPRRPARSANPPVLLEQVLAWLLPSTARADILGDLREDHRRALERHGRLVAVARYAVQVLAIGASSIGAVTRDAVVRGVLADVVHAWRSVVRRPALSLVVTGSIGLGLGLATAVFTVVNGLLFVPLPYVSPDRLVEIDEWHPVEVCQGCSVGAPASGVAVWRSAGASVSGVEAIDGRRAVIRIAGVAERIDVAAVTPGLIGLLGLRLEIGAGWPASAVASGSSSGDTVLLSHGFWERRFGADESVVGRAIVLDGQSKTIAGVLAQRSTLPTRADVLLPLEPSTVSSADDPRWTVIARLAPGVSVADAEFDLARLHVAIDDGDRAADGWSPRVRPLRAAAMDDLDDPMGPSLALLAALLLLLIACLNVCAVLIAQVASRAGEFAVRRALGAHRRRLLRLVLLEVSWLGIGGALLAVAIAILARDALVAALGGVLPPWVVFPLDIRVFATVLILGLVAIAVAGLVPGLIAAGVAGDRPAATLRSQRAPIRQRRLRVLVAMQVAAGMVLLAGTVDVVRTAAAVRDFSNLRHRVDDIVTISTSPARAESDQADAMFDRLARVTDALGALPGVGLVAVEQRLFLGSWGGPGSPSRLRLAGRPEAVPDAVVPRHSLAVSPDWFRLMEIPILRGRAIDARDRLGATGAVVVSEATAQQLWPDDDPIGQAVHIEDWPASPLLVVGVAADVVGNPLSTSRRVLPRLYAAVAQAPSGTDAVWLVDTASPATQSEDWRRRLGEVAPELIVTEVFTVEGGLRRWTAGAAGMAWVLGVAGLLAAGLLAMGIHGTLGFQVAYSRRELGIRRALGAGRGALTASAVGGLSRWIGGALVAGGTGAWIIGGLLQARGMGSSNPVAIALAAAVLVVVGVLSGSVALRRALSISPLASIRDE